MLKLIPNEDFMRLAIKEARKNITKPLGGPFGACIVKKGIVIARAHNKVLTSDATSHAEINAIRKASRKLGSFDLAGCEVYSTCEPCPMCFSAIHWARIGTIVFGSSIGDAAHFGFNEMPLSNATLKRLSRSNIKIVRRFLKKDCDKLFTDWQSAYKMKLLY